MRVRLALVPAAVLALTACTPSLSSSPGGTPATASPGGSPAAASPGGSPAAGGHEPSPFPPRTGDDAPTAALRRAVGPQVEAVLVLPDEILVATPDGHGHRLRNGTVSRLGADDPDTPVGHDPFPLETFPLAEVQGRLKGRQARITRDGDNDPLVAFGTGLRLGESAPGDEDAGVTETWLPGWRAVPKFDLTTREGLSAAVEEVGAQTGPRLTSFVYELGRDTGVTVVDQSGKGWQRREVFPLTSTGTTPPTNEPFDRSRITVDALERIITTCQDEKPEGTGIRIEGVSRGGRFGYEVTVPTDHAPLIADADQTGRVTFR